MTARPIAPPSLLRRGALLLALSLASFGASTATAQEPADAASRDIAPVHADATVRGIDLVRYAAALERHTVATSDVVGTRVDYRGLANDADWRRVSTSVREARPSRLDRQGQVAFWVNAYNILTIDLILQHYPIESIRDIGSFLFPVWNVEVATIEGKAISLGEIEHEILRAMDDPRIHGAIVCASTSCPPLARTPFRAETIDADLDAAMRRWLSIPEKGYSIDHDAGRLHVSKVFDWFDDDFEITGGVRATIARYADAEDAAWLRGPGQRVRIRYLDYDWTLNDRVRDERAR